MATILDPRLNLQTVKNRLILDKSIIQLITQDLHKEYKR